MAVVKAKLFFTRSQLVLKLLVKQTARSKKSWFEVYLRNIEVYLRNISQEKNAKNEIAILHVRLVHFPHGKNQKSCLGLTFLLSYKIITYHNLIGQ